MCSRDLVRAPGSRQSTPGEVAAAAAYPLKGGGYRPIDDTWCNTKRCVSSNVVGVDVPLMDGYGEGL